MLAMETPARSASARTSAADVPSAMARPSRSLRISTVAMPSARASAKKSCRLRRGAAMWFRAKSISATQTPVHHRSRPQDMRPAECRTPRRDRARTSLGRTDVAAGHAASTTSGPSPPARSSSSMEQTDHYFLLMEWLFHFGSIVNALEPGSGGRPSSRSAPGPAWARGVRWRAFATEWDHSRQDRIADLGDLEQDGGEVSHGLEEKLDA